MVVQEGDACLRIGAAVHLSQSVSSRAVGWNFWGEIKSHKTPGIATYSTSRHLFCSSPLAPSAAWWGICILSRRVLQVAQMTHALVWKTRVVQVHHFRAFIIHEWRPVSSCAACTSAGWFIWFSTSRTAAPCSPLPSWSKRAPSLLYGDGEVGV